MGWSVEEVETHSLGQCGALGVTLAPQSLTVPGLCRDICFWALEVEVQRLPQARPSPEHSTLTHPPNFPMQARAVLPQAGPSTDRDSYVGAVCSGHVAVWFTVVYLQELTRAPWDHHPQVLCTVLATVLGSPSSHQEPTGALETPWSQTPLVSQLGWGPGLAAKQWGEGQEDKRPHTWAPTEPSKVPSMPSATR